MCATKRSKPATSERKRPKQSRSRATVDAILEAGARILVERGWSGTSTNRIAAKAGVAIGTLYQFFPSKEAIVGALIDRHVDAQLAIAGQRLAAGGDVIAAAIEGLFDGAARAPELHVALLGLVGHVERAERLREVERHAAQIVAASMSEHATDREAAARVLVRAVTVIVLSFVNGDLEELSRDRVVAQTISLARRFLEPPP